MKWYPGWWFQDMFIFTPILGEDEPIFTNIFQMGWFNHQLVSTLPETNIAPENRPPQ